MQVQTAGASTAADWATHRASAAASPHAATAQGRTAQVNISATSCGALQSMAQSAATHKRNAPIPEVTTSQSAVGAQRRQKPREWHRSGGEENQHETPRGPGEQPQERTVSHSAGRPRHLEDETEATLKRRWRTQQWGKRGDRTLQWARARRRRQRQRSPLQRPALKLKLKRERPQPSLFRATQHNCDMSYIGTMPAFDMGVKRYAQVGCLLEPPRERE